MRPSPPPLASRPRLPLRFEAVSTPHEDAVHRPVVVAPQHRDGHPLVASAAGHLAFGLDTASLALVRVEAAPDAHRQVVRCRGEGSCRTARRTGSTRSTRDP
ncbi:hypothetical protein L1887_43285 [Cichorium endivia]|nr:hypothetical protein L1887_43285 [Cichorium endivia]